MPKYLYQARGQNGKIQTGQLEAADENDVRGKLRAQNLTLVRAIMQKGPGGARGATGGRVSSRDLQIFTRQFSTLINAGIPIVDSLKMLSEGKRDPVLKDVSNKVRESIEGGKRLADAMGQHPQIFDRFFVNMVRAGEEAGILDGILGRLSVYMEKSEKIKKQVRGALMYPAVIVVVAICVVVGILVFIIPRFQTLYENAGRELPAVTRLVIGLSGFIVSKWYMVVGVVIIAPIALLQWYRTEEGKKSIDRIMIQLPLFGDLVQKSSVARMTRTLSTLLSSGVGVIDALEIAARTSGNVVIEEALVRCKESVISGRPLAAPLTREPLIPEMVTQMIAIGEKSGTLDAMLSKIADFYEDDVENAVKGLTSMIEPILMVVLGSIIAVLVIAMYLPIFDLANTAGG